MLLQRAASWIRNIARTESGVPFLLYLCNVRKCMECHSILISGSMYIPVANTHIYIIINGRHDVGDM